MIFKKIDRFGKEFKFNLEGRGAQRNTVLGGIITLLCYILAIAYFAYLIYLWAEFRIMPKIIIKSDYQSKHAFTFDYTPIIYGVKKGEEYELAEKVYNSLLQAKIVNPKTEKSIEV